MAYDVSFEQINETFVRIIATNDIVREISGHFSFKIPNAQFDPRVRSRMWDGVVRLVNLRERKIYTGLLPELIKFLRDEGYRVAPVEFGDHKITEAMVREFATTVGVPFTLHDHQVQGILHAINPQRGFLVSPTSSGKSLIIYLYCRIALSLGAKRCLVVVPTLALITQMVNDFRDYGYTRPIDTIKAGVKKDSVSSKIVVSTWQSLQRLDQDWFEPYGCVVGDEAHLYPAKSCTRIFENCINAEFRLGLTGTLTGATVHNFVLQGLFGPIDQFITTREMIDANYATDVHINCVHLVYPDEVKKAKHKLPWAEEYDWLLKLERRNQFIVDLTKHLKDNTLILFRKSAQGKALRLMCTEQMPGKTVFYVDKDTPIEKRDMIREYCKGHDDAIIVGSFGTMSTGISINNLHNAIFASPSKGRIKLLQSIGRLLRKNANKELAQVYDLYDDLSWKSSLNTTLRHFLDRLRIYQEQEFKYTIRKVKLDVSLEA